jgi:hypothetical protein
MSDMRRRDFISLLGIGGGRPQRASSSAECFIFPRCSRAAGPPLMWASGHEGQIRRAAHGYEPTREAAMAAFAKSWLRE